jgi:hypothetical protein
MFEDNGSTPVAFEKSEGLWTRHAAFMRTMSVTILPLCQRVRHVLVKNLEYALSGQTIDFGALTTPDDRQIFGSR